MFLSKPTASNSNTRGFTLVELMVSITISLAILAVILFNQNHYTEGASLLGLADDIGLAFSQAQAYGVSVKEVAPGTDEFDAAYGLYFNLEETEGDTHYIYFADRGSKNGFYDSSWSCPVDTGSECLDKVALTGRNTISDICVIRRNGTERCNLGGVHVTFLRPDTNARFEFQSRGGGSPAEPQAVGAKINLRSQSGLTHSVQVFESGQISIQ